MSILRRIILLPKDADKREYRLHCCYTSLMLTLIGCGLGLLTLLLTACSYPLLNMHIMLRSYFQNPTLVALNLLPAVLLVWLFTFVSGRAWCGVLLGELVTLGMTLGNYYKVSLRGDPFLPSDIALLRTVGGVLGRYTLELSPAVLFSLGAAVAALLYSLLLLTRRMLSGKVRMLGILLCIALLAASYFGLYANGKVYLKTANEQQINIWSDVQVFTSRGFFVSFLHALPDAFPNPPENYRKAEAKQLLEQYSDADIPNDRKVSVMAVMLEAFCDLTEFDMLNADRQVQQVYAPMHELEAQSISGRLLTNIFAGGTVESEWEFLTGASQFDTFRTDTASYVRYFAAQGYSTHYTHPGYNWMYNRRNVNSYLGFAESFFTEDGFAELVDPVTAAWHSDAELVDYLLADLDDAQGSPRFSFAVSYQNHGPYETATCGRDYAASLGLSEESRCILNNYLAGVEETIREYVRLSEELEKRNTPVVLVLFGDHKPWLGNNNSVYAEIGANFDISVPEGFAQYYATPYLIWANSAAKRVLGSVFIGNGGDFSPCFLMTRLFDACQWDGPGFLQLSREMRAVTPLLSVHGLYLQNGILTAALDPAAASFLQSCLGAQYYREHSLKP